ncbi:MAG: hypothetical protein J7L54_07235 [Elusimicrobia bacterium]|nr:hypothetical protein [Elusimicrobiota bacterium]
MKKIIFILVFFSAGVHADRAGVSFLKISPLLPLENLGCFNNGISGFWHNPALLGGKKEAAVAYNAWLDGVKLNYLAVGLPSAAGNFGFSLTYLDSGKIPETTSSAKDGTGNYFSSLAFRARAGYSKKLGYFRFGISFSDINEEIAGKKASGGCLSAGIFRRGKNLEFSFFLRNFGWMTEMDEKSSSLPAMAGFGAARIFKSGKLGFIVSATSGENLSVSVGGGVTAFKKGGKMLEFLVGYRTGFEDAGGFAGFSAAARVKVDGLSIRLSAHYFADLGSPLRISIGFAF